MPIETNTITNSIINIITTNIKFLHYQKAFNLYNI